MSTAGRVTSDLGIEVTDNEASDYEIPTLLIIYTLNFCIHKSAPDSNIICPSRSKADPKDLVDKDRKKTHGHGHSEPWMRAVPPWDVANLKGIPLRYINW